jgi:hypothetical protein
MLNFSEKNIIEPKMIEDFYPVLKAYCDWVRAQSPSWIDSFCLTSALSAMAACIGPTRKTPFGDGIIHYFVLVAGSGVGKRAPTVCCSKIVSMMSKKLTINRDPNSSNGLLTRLRQQPGLIYTMQEFGAWFEQICNSQSTSHKQISNSFLKLWDCPAMLDGFDAKKEADSMDGVAFPVLNILANMTNDAWMRVTKLKGFKHDGLGGRFEPIIITEDDEQLITLGRLKLVGEDVTDVSQPPKMVLDTFAEMSKLTIQDIEKAKRNPTPEDPNQAEYSDIIFRNRVPFQIAEDARNIVEELRLYAFHSKRRFDGIAEHIVMRQATRVIRTACLLAAFDLRDEVSVRDVYCAMSYHNDNFARAKPFYDLGMKDDNIGAIEETIIEALKNRGLKMKWSEVWKLKSIKNNSHESLMKAKRSLIASGRIIVPDPEKTRGRPCEWIFLATDEIVEKPTLQLKAVPNKMPDDKCFLKPTTEE